MRACVRARAQLATTEVQQQRDGGLDLRECEDMLNRVMTKDNIAVAALLESRLTGRRLFVANAHIHWDPTFKDVKVVQTAMLTERIHRILEEVAPQAPVPLVICGDFNSLPDSGVYEFLNTGRIGEDHDDLSLRQYGRFVEGGIQHGFKLRSAYAAIGELPYTNYTYDFVGVIDYEWYTTDRLAVNGLLGPMDQEYMRKIKGCPNAHFSSDHLPLLVEYRVLTPNNAHHRRHLHE